jgi:exodeoxyribonuclease VII small subunit
MARKKASTSPPDQSESEAFDFEASLAEVEQIVSQLEGGELGLSESLQQYEMGIRHLKRCHGLLAAAQQRVSLLSGFDADGNPVTEPFGVPTAPDEKKREDLGRRDALAPRRSEGVSDAVNLSAEDPDTLDETPGLF